MNRDKITSDIVNVYDGFVDTLLSQGFHSYRDVSNEKVTNKHYYNYGAVSFTERDGRLISTYVSLHMNTVDGFPDKVFVIEYDVYTFSARSRIITHQYMDESNTSIDILNELANKISNANHVDLTAQFDDMEFVSFARVDTAIFKDMNGKLHTKNLLDCKLTHPGITLEKPEEF